MSREGEADLKANILLVDDDEDSLLALVSILSSLSQNLIKVRSGEEALKYLLHHDVALILLDVKLPGTDGFETANLIRAREKTQHIPIIFLTGVHIQDRQIFKGYSLGAVDYILKPFVPEILRSKVNVFVELFNRAEEIKKQSGMLQKSNELLQLSEKKFRAVAETAQDAIVCADDTGKITFFNKCAERIFGYSSEEAIGQSLSLLMPERFRQAHENGFQRFLSTGEAHFIGSTVELIGKHKDNTEFPIEISLACCSIENRSYFTAIIRDVTERKRVMMERSRLASIIDSSDDAIISNTLSGIILSWNKGAERIFGYFSYEIIGQPISRLIHPDMPEEIEHILKQITEGDMVEHYETICRRKDGLSIDVSLTISTIRDSSDTIIAASAIARDITERKNLLREILEAGEREQQRIGQDLHDDLCQQLTGIAYMSKALEKKLNSDSMPEAAEVMKISKQLDQTISYTRFLAKGLVPTELETGGLIPALQVFAADVEGTTGIPCSFNSECEFPIQDPTVAGHLYRIVQEAVNNAVVHGQAKHLGIGLSTNDQTVIITVYDDGLGIPEGVSRGQGMGLRSIGYRAGLIGARVNFQQNVNGGTTVICSLKRKNIS